MTALRPSAMYRWARCPGSVALIGTLPPGEQNVDSPYAAEGRDAHELARRLLLRQHPGLGSDPEMIEHVRVYTDEVWRRFEAEGDRAQIRIEQRVPIGSGVADGTADAVIIGRKRLTVCDLKYGAGVPVDVIENPQLLAYLLGTFESLAPIDQAAIDELVLVIVQPRRYHRDGPIREWIVPRETLFRFRDRLAGLVAATRAPGAPLAAGPWCQFCPARGACPALRDASLAIARTEFDVPAAAPPPPELLTNAEIGAVLEKGEILETWLAGVRERAFAELTAGRAVPGWKLVPKRPRREWVSEEKLQEWAGVGRRFMLYEQKLKSPAQIEKLVGKKHLPPELYQSVSSGATLAPADDPRPALGAGDEFTVQPEGT